MAETVSVTIGELSTALENRKEESDAIQQMVLDRIQARFDEIDIAINQGEAIYRESLNNKTVEGGCNRTIVLNMQTTLVLRSDSRFSLELNSLYEPITFGINLDTSLSATGRARQIVGIRLGECQDLARDSFDFSATGPVGLSLSVSITLLPEFIDETTLRITPTLAISSRLNTWDIRSDVDDSAFRVLLEQLLQAEVEDALGPERIEAELSTLQTLADEWLAEAIPDGFIDFQLPEPNDEQIIALFDLLQRDASFPLTLEYVRRHRNEVLAALLLGDTEALSDVTTDAVACQAADVLQIPLAHEPIFVQSDSGCIQTAFNADHQNAYGDAACLQPVNVTTTSLNDFCEVALSSERLGNAANDPVNLENWTLSPGNTFDIGSLSLTGMRQPWMQRVNYKTVFTGRGECRLEMRIYTTHPNASARTPVIALHGGSWQHRGSGFLGIETTATQFVDSGFIVFAPFYRLIGTDDGNTECNNANIDDALADTQDALDWVISNGERYGSTGQPVVFGQSAGGHLAASLAINRSEDISRAILLYAPTDFSDFAEQIQQGQYTGDQGRRILEAVTGQAVESLDLGSSLISNNSFPQIIASQPGAYPPMFVLHGQSDTLLPFRQSVRLCNSLSGNPASGPASLDSEISQRQTVVNCDDKGSELHLIQEGQHALDLCIAPELCFAGSPESRRKTEDSLRRMLQWAAAETLPEAVESGPNGTGTPSSFFLLLLLVFQTRTVKFSDYRTQAKRVMKDGLLKTAKK